MAVTLSTPDELVYRFHPVSGKQIQFRIKAPNDAHIALTTGPFEGDPMYEVFIGGWSNSKSVIRKNRSKPDVAEVDTPDILSNDDYRGFWIRWYDGSLTVGREGEQEPFMSYSDPESFEITHFGVCTGWGASGDWVLEDSDGATAPPAPQVIGLSDDNNCWCDASSGIIPPGAIEGGNDDGPLFVGRAKHEGALIPGKVKPSHSVCYIPWGGAEHAKNDYQVLCNCNTAWVATSGGAIPPNAVPGGQSEDGEALFIGRVQHDGTVTIGKVQPTHSVLYIPYGGSEVSFEEYEILVKQ